MSRFIFPTNAERVILREMIAKGYWPGVNQQRIEHSMARKGMIEYGLPNWDTGVRPVTLTELGRRAAESNTSSVEVTP